jgi:hypothetical protein
MNQNRRYVLTKTSANQLGQFVQWGLNPDTVLTNSHHALWQHVLSSWVYRVLRGGR